MRKKILNIAQVKQITNYFGFSIILNLPLKFTAIYLFVHLNIFKDHVTQLEFKTNQLSPSTFLLIILANI